MIVEDLVFREVTVGLFEWSNKPKFNLVAFG